MTANDVYSIALSYNSTTREEDSSLDDHVLNWLNTCLQELLPTENSIRRADGRELLEAAPVLALLADTLTYSDILMRTAAPYFLASQIMKDDNDNTWAARYYEMYLNAVRDASVDDTETGVTDCWKEE